jgi:hypothetical protein
MYGRGSIGPEGSTISGAGGAISILGGSMVLPNTSGNPLLMVLSLATIAMGVVVVASFFLSRYLATRA